jgi:hypothetical protein
MEGMVMRTTLVGALVALLVGSAGAPLLAKDKPRKPKLEIRVLPRMGMAPSEVLVMADLREGDDIEDYYCLEMEVDWDDGTRSVKESDCPPFEPGTKIERHYSASHQYRRSGIYNVRVTLRHVEQVVAAGKIDVTLRAGLGEAE